MNLLALLLNRYVLGGLAITALLAGVFWAGNIYGPNAKAYAKCKVETERRNAAVARANAIENAKHDKEEAARLQASKAFANCPNIQQCILTKETAACLDLLD